MQCARLCLTWVAIADWGRDELGLVERAKSSSVDCHQMKHEASKCGWEKKDQTRQDSDTLAAMMYDCQSEKHKAVAGRLLSAGSVMQKISPPSVALGKATNPLKMTS